MVLVFILVAIALVSCLMVAGVVGSEEGSNSLLRIVGIVAILGSVGGISYAFLGSNSKSSNDNSKNSSSNSGPQF